MFIYPLWQSSAALTSAYKGNGSAGSTTPKTYTAFDIGAASSDRLVIVVVPSSGGGAGRNISSITIGGVTATLHTNQSTGGGQTSICLASANVPTGTTADIVITWSAAPTTQGLMVWTLSGYSSATPYSSYGNADASSASTKVATLNTVAGGILFVGAMHSANDTVTWSSITEDDDFQVNAAAVRMGGGRNSSLTTTVSNTETATWTGSQFNSIAAAVWQ